MRPICQVGKVRLRRFLRWYQQSPPPCPTSHPHLKAKVEGAGTVAQRGENAGWRRRREWPGPRGRMRKCPGGGNEAQLGPSSEFQSLETQDNVDGAVLAWLSVLCTHQGSWATPASLCWWPVPVSLQSEQGDTGNMDRGEPGPLNFQAVGPVWNPLTFSLIIWAARRGRPPLEPELTHWRPFHASHQRRNAQRC